MRLRRMRMGTAIPDECATFGGWAPYPPLYGKQVIDFPGFPSFRYPFLQTFGKQMIDSLVFTCFRSLFHLVLGIWVIDFLFFSVFDT